MYPIASSRHLEAGTNSRRPIKSGPITYPGSPNFFGFIICTIAFKYVLVMYCYFLVKTGSLEYSIAFVFLYIGLIISFGWPFLFLRPSFRTISSMKVCQTGYLVCGMFLFILDTLFLFVVLSLHIVFGTNYFFDLPPGAKLNIYAIIPVTCLLVGNGIAITMLHHVDVRDYSPMGHSNRYNLAKSSQRSNRHKVFSIKESNSFRIVIENSSEQPWVEPLVIQREIRWVTRRSRGKYDEDMEIVKFFFSPKEPLEPGDEWIFIPETHREEGSHRIGGFRSFGRDRGERVQTVVMKYAHWEELERLEENYTYIGNVSTAFTMRYGRYES